MHVDGAGAKEINFATISFFRVITHILLCIEKISIYIYE